MIKIPRSPTAERNNATDDAAPCVICGKLVKAPKFMLHVHQGGSHAVTAEEAADLNANGGEPSDCGGHPIGADCLRRHPELKPYVIAL
jgi:hypothetical protein